MPTVSQACLSPKEIEDHIAYIGDMLSSSRPGDGRLPHLADVQERFRHLRSQYQADPKSLEGHVARLSQFSRQFDALLDARLPELVDRYHDVVEQIRRAESEKEFLRDFLIRQAGVGRASLRGSQTEVTIRSKEGRLLPGAGTQARGELERLILQSGQWPLVSLLSRAKVQRALADGRFGAAQESIAQLCPVTVMHQVISRSK